MGEIIAGALGGGDLDELRSRSDALCELRPLYPGYRGYPEYRA